MKKFLTVLLLSSVATVACADEYLYVENPDPSKYFMTWEGPGPNCSETSGGYQTKGWIFHPGGQQVVVTLKSKKKPPSPVCVAELRTVNHTHFSYFFDCGDAVSTSNTHWITMKGYKSYKTWACG